MANSFSGSVSVKSLDRGEGRPPFDTGWHSGGFAISNQPSHIQQNQREQGNASNVLASGGDVGPSDYNNTWSRGGEVTDPTIDRFDDVPIIRGSQIDYAAASNAANANIDSTVESLNSCPLSDLLNDEVPSYHQAQPEFQQLEPARTVYTTIKHEPSTSSFISQSYSQMPPGNNNFLPTTTNTLPLATANVYHQSSSILDASASALRAAGFGQPEYSTTTTTTTTPSLQQSPYESRRRPYDYVPQPPPVPHRQHHASGTTTANQFSGVSSGYAFRQGHLSGQLATGMPSSSSTSTFQSPSLTNSSFQSASEYYTQPHQPQHLNPQFQNYLQQPSLDQQSSFVPRPIRERFLSAPGGAFARMDQISSFFGSMSSGFNADFQNERSRSPYSRSSSAGGGASPWCPSPLQHTLQMGTSVNPVGGYSAAEQANVLQFAEMNAQNSYFWQYNAQSKQRGHRAHSIQDPYSFDEEFRDPIFANDSADNDVEPGVGETNQQLLRHPGKARRGDGTDTTPNPTLLYCIGNLLAQLNTEINGIHQYQQQQNEQEMLQTVAGKVKHASGSSVDSSMLPTNRREKNMLASRVCRLKRKAQHEANKIVMAGLKQESESVLRSIAAVEEMLRERILSSGGSGAGTSSPSQSISQDFRVKITPFSNATVRCAGRTSEFVSDVLQRISTGDPTGGLKVPTVATTMEDVDSDQEASTSHYIASLNRSADLTSKSSAAQFSRKRHNSSHPRLVSSAKAPASDIMNNSFAM